mmetsp:Transcript_58525/g.188027  ORF Transcript_58525/g.188027 Transcript_58525/m.188027 type:complete len:216 (-) Transcript_58525:668-1315(-)
MVPAAPRRRQRHLPSSATALASTRSTRLPRPRAPKVSAMSPAPLSRPLRWRLELRMGIRSSRTQSKASAWPSPRPGRAGAGTAGCRGRRASAGPCAPWRPRARRSGGRCSSTRRSSCAPPAAASSSRSSSAASSSSTGPGTSSSGWRSCSRTRGRTSCCPSRGAGASPRRPAQPPRPQRSARPPRRCPLTGPRCSCWCRTAPGSTRGRSGGPSPR